MANVQRGLPAGPGGVQVPGGPGAPGVPGPQPPGAVQVGPATAQAVVSRPGGPAGIIHGAVTTYYYNQVLIMLTFSRQN